MTEDGLTQTTVSPEDPKTPEEPKEPAKKASVVATAVAAAVVLTAGVACGAFLFIKKKFF